VGQPDDGTASRLGNTRSAALVTVRARPTSRILRAAPNSQKNQGGHLELVGRRGGPLQIGAGAGATGATGSTASRLRVLRQHLPLHGDRSTVVDRAARIYVDDTLDRVGRESARSPSRQHITRATPTPQRVDLRPGDTVTVARCDRSTGAVTATSGCRDRPRRQLRFPWLRAAALGATGAAGSTRLEHDHNTRPVRRRIRKQYMKKDNSPKPHRARHRSARRHRARRVRRRRVVVNVQRRRRRRRRPTAADTPGPTSATGTVAAARRSRPA